MKIFKMLMLCVCLSGPAQTASALPMVQTAACENDAAATCATGVAGIDVLGTLYDVVFSQASYDDIFASTDPVFFGDIPGAAAPVAALSGVLNVASIVGLIGDRTFFGSFLIVPHAVLNAADLDAEQATHGVGNIFTGDSASAIMSAIRRW